MAIDQDVFNFLKIISENGLFPPDRSVLELGEAEWYGDVNPMEILGFIADEALRDRVGEEIVQASARLNEAYRKFGQSSLERYLASVAIAKIFYRHAMKFSSVEAVDPGFPDRCMDIDLNHEHDIGRRFDVIINNGTAEHVFNIGNVFKFMHDHTALNGVMIHFMPFQGYVDHGMYNIQPTLYFDMAAENDYGYLIIIKDLEGGYKVISKREEIWEMYSGNAIRKNSIIFSLMEKTADRPFKFPIQGIYSRKFSREQELMWLNHMRDV